MLTIGSLAFLTPWILSALVILPVLWILLRLMPPAPKRQLFPALRLLLDLDQREETPARTPWWILLLRTILVAAAITALADPVLNPQQEVEGSGALVLVVDTDWPAARDWQARQQVMERLIDEAGREDRSIYLLATARDENGEPLEILGPLPSAEAKALAAGLRPHPWPAAREEQTALLQALRLETDAHVVWLSSGLASPSLADDVQALRDLGEVSVYLDVGASAATLLRPARLQDGVLTLPAERAYTGAEQTITVRAMTNGGQILDRVPATFAAGEATVEAQFDLPASILSQIDRLQLEGERTAGGVILVDDSVRRRAVGLFAPDGGSNADEVSPLLSELFYIDRALSISNPVFRGSLPELMAQNVSVLVMADVGVITPSEMAMITPFLEEGGVLIRFAGPKMAANRTPDPLVPVGLMEDSRTLGGAMSWPQPAGLAPFPESSPLAGIQVSPDVTVDRQVLAEPALDLEERTWASLEDGTPLITARREGLGWLVLVHTTANTRWSDLALSGTFVQVLRKLTELSIGTEAQGNDVALQPVSLMDGYGSLGDPAGAAGPIAAGEFAFSTASPRTPPGLYGGEGSVRALNLSSAVPEMVPVGDLPSAVTLRTFEPPQETNLKALLLLLALGLLLADLLISLILRGGLSAHHARRTLMPGAKAALVGVLVLGGATLATAPVAEAQRLRAPTAENPDERTVIELTDKAHFAYVLTGDSRVDGISQAGLDGLATILRARTSVDAGDAVAVDLEQSELSLFPLIYWPITSAQPPLSDTAVRRLNEYMRNGGTVVFDTRDQNQGTGAMGSVYLQRLVGSLDVPPLQRVPEDHVLTKSFYLLDEFPGRYSGGDVWVEAASAQRNDGVSSIIVGGHDWASAWARRPDGRPLYPVSGGGRRQRVYAERFGINLAMYVLTGNYKSDQVHIPEIMKRLGQ